MFILKVYNLEKSTFIDCLMFITSSGGDEDKSLYKLLSQYKPVEHKAVLSHHTLKNLPCPTLYPSDLKGTTLSCDPHSFLEWLGAVNLDISWWESCGIKFTLDCNKHFSKCIIFFNSENAADSFLSTYICPEPKSSVSQALLCTITGFISPEDVYLLLQELRYDLKHGCRVPEHCFLTTIKWHKLFFICTSCASFRKYFDEPKFTPWLSLTVHGFMDSPVSWGATEHGFLKGGENFYNLVCFKNQDYWLHMATGAHDGCPP